MSDSDAPAAAEVSTEPMPRWVRIPFRILILVTIALMAWMVSTDSSGWLEPVPDGYNTEYGDTNEPVDTGQGGTHSDTMPEAP